MGYKRRPGSLFRPPHWYYTPYHSFVPGSSYHFLYKAREEIPDYVIF
jgi:hypothetical protein